MRISSFRIFSFAFVTTLFALLTGCISTQKLSSVKFAENTKQVLSQSQQRKFEYFYLEALRLKYSQQPDASFDLLNRCLIIDSTSAVVCYELADISLKMNNPVLAVDYIRKATALAPDNYWYMLSFANLTQSLNMKDEAENAFIKLSNEYPDKPELSYSLVEIYSNNKEYRKAIEMLDKLGQQVGLSEEISIEKFRLYTLLKDPKKAFAEIDKLVQAYPKDVRYRILLGDMYLDSNQLKEAFNCYQSAGNVEPDNGYLSVSLSNYYEKTGDKVEADRQIRKALLNPKTDLETKNRILNVYLSTRLEKPEEAKNICSLFDTLIEMHPQDENFYLLYAGYLVTQKKQQEAREKLIIAAGLAPTNVDVWKQLLNVNLQLNDYKSVVEVCKKAITYFPEAAEFYFYQGMGYFLSDNFVNAIASYQKGIKVLDPKNVGLLSDYYGQIGDVYQRLNKKDSAYIAYDNALKYNEKNVAALNNYAYYLSIDKKDLNKAEQMSGRCVAVDPNNSTYLDTYAWIYFVQKNYTLAKFYIEKALKNGGDKSDVIVEHYGDILFMMGDKKKGIENWILSKKMGNASETLQKKIETRSFIEEPVK